MKSYRAIGLGLMLLATCAWAEQPRLELPSFKHLESKAVEAVDFTLDRWMIRPAQWFVADDADGEELKRLLEGIESVRIRSYSFDEDYVYSKSDLDKVRRKLSGSGWSPVLQAHDRDSGEDIGIYMAVEGDKTVGFALIASDPREFTIVHVAGAVDLETVQKVRARFQPHKPERPGANALARKGVIVAQQQ